MPQLNAERFFLEKFGNKLSATDSWVIRFAEEYHQKKISERKTPKEKSICAFKSNSCGSCPGGEREQSICE